MEAFHRTFSFLDDLSFAMTDTLVKKALSIDNSTFVA